MTGRIEDPSRYAGARTLINNLAEQRQLAWIEAPIWPPIGSVIELAKPNRDAIVIGVRLQLLPGTDAVILVDVRELEDWEHIPRHAADQILREERAGDA